MHIGEISEVIKQKAMEQADIICHLIINLRYSPYNLYLGYNLHILAISSIV